MYAYGKDVFFWCPGDCSLGEGEEGRLSDTTESFLRQKVHPHGAES